MQPELHLPLVYAKWKMQQNEPGQCTATTGHKGVTATVRKDNGSLVPQISGNWPMQPGMEFIINVSGHTYRSSSGKFAPAESETIIQDFRQADKAYLEWSSAGYMRNNKRDNIIKLDGFSAAYDACRKSLEPRKAKKRRK